MLCGSFVTEQSLSQTVAALLSGCASGWVMGVSPGRYRIQEPAGANQPDFPGSRLCVGKSVLSEIRAFPSCTSRGCERQEQSDKRLWHCLDCKTVKSWQIFRWANWLTRFFLPKFYHVPAGLVLSSTISTTFGEPVSALELDLKGHKSSSAKAEDGTWIQLCIRTD